jgi:hypothetical protein
MEYITFEQACDQIDWLKSEDDGADIFIGKLEIGGDEVLELVGFGASSGIDNVYLNERDAEELIVKYGLSIIEG